MSGKVPSMKVSPERSLTQLLDGLTKELLAAPDPEIAVTLWELDAAGRNALKAARDLIASLDEPSDTPEAAEVIAPGRRIDLPREY